MEKKIVLEMQDVTVELGGKVVLKDINLKVFEHETLVLIGPSGSGKTVLLKTLAGLYSPSKGRVLVEGEDWQSLESDEKHHLAEKIGMMFQQSALFDQMTALENVEFPLKEHFDYPQDEVDKMAMKLLSRVNLADHHDKIPSQLSGGMQKRLGIARALAMNPEVVFYDDPVAGQDPIQSDQMSKLIKELQKKNDATVIIVTSNMRVAYQMADRILMVIGHEIIDAGTPEETWKHPDPRIQQFIKGNLEGPISIKR
jgi:phospholipid/cholesterol/gamma-HCH transport system ATP-binding protein